MYMCWFKLIIKNFEQPYYRDSVYKKKYHVY